MLATFWDKLFEYKDKVKKEYGKKSIQYRTATEIEDILQEAYDECNRIKDIEALNARPRDNNDRFIFEKLPEVKIYEDKDGYYYILDGQHLETSAEVFDYIIKDRRNKYKQMNAKYVSQFRSACVKMSKKLYNYAKCEFMDSLDYEEYAKDCSCVIRDTKGSEEE